ncbi:MAG: 30S ribosomal protein S2 [Actinobacteria bacterium]|nr:30S ribosomal protein S2 [Actinomycetota bacterium]MCL6088392.1 30S ribosomal protein S2 [Actinomycetota bacterium]
MEEITIKQLLEAGVHFGHQTRRWNPKMKRYIYTARNGIYIIDLQQTLTLLKEAYEFAKNTVINGGIILFVGTKKQIQDIIESNAQDCKMPYVKNRWLGGALTNFETISKRKKRMDEIEEMEKNGVFEKLPKKEVLGIQNEYQKLNYNMGGIRHMNKLPEALFVIDPHKEEIAVKEAIKLGIPIIAITDTNCDPDNIDYVIPGNDDAIRACNLLCRVISNAVKEGSSGMEIVRENIEKEKLEQQEIEKSLQDENNMDDLPEDDEVWV